MIIHNLMPWKIKAGSSQVNPSAIMNETRRIVGNGHYKVEDILVKLDKRRLANAPSRSLKYSLGDITVQDYSTPHQACRLRLAQCDSLEAAEVLSAEHGGVPMVLDFASGSNPGGGLKGNQQGTQEEDMCRRSSLLASLEHHEYPLPDGGIYAPDICVFRGAGHTGYPLLEKPFWIAVLASEMPNCGDMGTKERAFVRQKIQGVLQMALRHGHTSVVLGAWGCGAFGNDPAVMAAIFKERAKRCKEGSYNSHHPKVMGCSAGCSICSEDWGQRHNLHMFRGPNLRFVHFGDDYNLPIVYSKGSHGSFSMGLWGRYIDSHWKEELQKMGNLDVIFAIRGASALADFSEVLDLVPEEVKKEGEKGRCCWRFSFGRMKIPMNSSCKKAI